MVAQILSTIVFEIGHFPKHTLNQKQLFLFKYDKNPYNSWFIGAISSSLLYQLLKDGEGRLNP
jgi:hypothetical protein